MNKIIKRIFYLYLSFLIKINLTKSNIDNNCFNIRLFKRNFIYKTKDSFLLLLSEVYLNKIYDIKLNSESPVIFDIGANIGISSFFFRDQFKKAKIYSFEANPLAYRILKYNDEKNNLQLHTFNYALGSSDEDRDFYFTLDDHVGASFYKSRSSNEGNKISVSQRKLSGFINEEIDLMKIDVEGAEMEIVKELDEASKLKFFKNIIAEFHCNISENPNSLINFLQIFEKNNFRFVIHNSTAGIDDSYNYHTYMIYLVRQ